MPKSILVTTEFSESCKSALKWAANWCSESGHELIILHSYRLQNKKGENVFDFMKIKEAEARERFAVLEKEVLSDTNLKYSLKVGVGFAADRVQEIINSNKIGFVVIDKMMYSRNRENFDELVEEIQVPIIIAPATTQATNALHTLNLQSR